MTQALDALYWRAEILQAMFWMRGEGIDAEVDARRLAEFLAVDRETVTRQMAILEVDGYLARIDDARYALTESGVEEGGRSFADEFADLTHAAHYECAPGCWCHAPDHVGEPCPSSPAPGPVPPLPSLPPDEPKPDPEARRGG